LLIRPLSRSITRPLSFVALIAWMYHVLAHRPGGQPIGALEFAFTRAAKSVRRLMPQSQRA